MDDWEKNIACAGKCEHCDSLLDPKQKRILSVYDHKVICMVCKKIEEQKSDYEDVSKAMIADCIKKTDRPYGNPGGFCFHHFCPYKC